MKIHLIRGIGIGARHLMRGGLLRCAVGLAGRTLVVGTGVVGAVLVGASIARAVADSHREP